MMFGAKRRLSLKETKNEIFPKGASDHVMNILPLRARFAIRRPTTSGHQDQQISANCSSVGTLHTEASEAAHDKGLDNQENKNVKSTSFTVAPPSSPSASRLFSTLHCEPLLLKGFVIKG
jgi:hypothetical protein